jgi:hypothetical protein
VTHLRVLQFIVCGVVIIVWASAWVGGIFFDPTLIDAATTLNKPAFAVIGFVLGKEFIELMAQTFVLRKDSIPPTPPTPPTPPNAQGTP